MAKSTKSQPSVDEAIRAMLGIGNKQPKEVFNISEGQMEFLYNHVYSLFQSGKFKEALETLNLLTRLDPLNFRYVFAKAACYHHLKDYPKAISEYWLASTIESEDPLVYYYLYDCLTKAKKPDQAEVVLNMVVEKAGTQPKYKEVKQRALLELDKFKKKTKS